MRKILVILILAIPFYASAHPLGMKEFGFRTQLHLYPDHIECEHTAEIPTAVLISEIDKYKSEHGIPKFREEDNNRFNQEMLEKIGKGLKLYIDGARRGWQDIPEFTDRTGRGDVNFFEYRLRLVAVFPDTGAGAALNMEVANDNFKGFESVFLNGLIAGPGVEVINSNIPQEMNWSRDYSYRKIKVSIKLNPDWGETTRLGSSAIPQRKIKDKDYREGGRLAVLLSAEDITPAFILIALATAFLLGAAHAMAPGHGKAIVGAFLASSRGKYIHAVLFGLIVTLTHTGIVFILGGLFLIAPEGWMPGHLSPYIGVASGIIIFLIGLYMFYRRLTERRVVHQVCHSEGALATEESPGSYTMKKNINWKAFIALGVGGGMIPCPSALALMLVAISINRVGWGMALVGAFSVGLASLLVGLGILVLGAANLSRRLWENGRLMRIVPFISAAVVTSVGIIVIINSLRLL